MVEKRLIYPFMFPEMAFALSLSLRFALFRVRMEIDPGGCARWLADRKFMASEFPTLYEYAPESFRLLF